MKPAAPGDASFEIVATPIQGVLFEPQAIYAPPMLVYLPKKKTTIEKQRIVYQNTKDAFQKEVAATVLASMLYDKNKAEKDDTVKAKAWTEALQVLTDAATGSGWDKADDTTLRLIGRYALLLNNYPTAEKGWNELVTRFPKEKDALENRAWLAYSQLMQYKNAEALDTVKAETPTEKTPELAYVTAWAKFRANDGAGAWSAILTASKGWGSLGSRDALDFELYLFAGRTGATLNDAITQLSPMFGKTPDVQQDVLAKLAINSYKYAGRWADGIAALDKAIAIGPTSPAMKDKFAQALPAWRYQQVDYALKLDDPAQVEKYAKLTLDALSACAASLCPDKDKLGYYTNIYGVTTLLYVWYASAHDDRFYQPAYDLYQALIPLLQSDPQVSKDLLQNSTNLAQFHANFAKKPELGAHAKDQIARLLEQHNQELQACYEQSLAANPKLGGTLVMNLESDQSGEMKGVSTEPKAGVSDMSAVAACAIEHAKTWRLPKIANGTGTHTTRIKMTYSMSQRQKTAPAPGGSPAPAAKP
ncbi:MAG TPA: AgmX/PglI C-terminal domain-containing protein [Kofleriaceae bacterium]